jgi:hypothetical protein
MTIYVFLLSFNLPFLLQDLFFQYSLNNFLHAQVETCVKYAFCCVTQPSTPKTSPTSPSKSIPETSDDTKQGKMLICRQNPEEALT